jgi:hypothetical protein
MIWIIGFGKKTSENLGRALRVQCPRCHNIVDYHLILIKSWFTLFFIRIFPYRSQHHLVCEICSHAVELEDAQVLRAKKLVKATAAFRRKKISEARYNEILGQSLGKRPFRQLTVQNGNSRNR